MRIALHATTEAGRRAGLILLAERALAALGMYGSSGSSAADRRMMRISTLEGFDLLATDDPEPSPLANIAFEDGLSCVTVHAVAPGVAARYEDSGLTLLEGASLKGLSTTLATHEAARVDHVVSSTAAWTTPGSALRKGIGVAFPDPVGARWGRQAAEGTEVPVPGSWAGAAATVAGVVEGKETERVVGVADHRGHLEGIALAAGAVAVAKDAYPTGHVAPAEAAEAYLSAALGAGLGVAAYNL
jgi:hypothetical protein